MELQAVIEALSGIKKGSLVEVTTDSQYVQKGMTTWIKNWKTKGWRTWAGQPVKNADLWQRLNTLAGLHRVSCRWVKAHTGDPGNERADALAKRGARGIRQK